MSSPPLQLEPMFYHGEIMNETLVSEMRMALSLLARRSFASFSLFMRGNKGNCKTLQSQAKVSAWTTALLFCLSGWAQAYTVVTSTNPALEKELICAATTQFSASLFVNPLASNTYQIKLLGESTTYNPAPSNADLLNAVVTVDSYTYVYGFVAGE
jgi:hypothetical protein